MALGRGYQLCQKSSAEAKAECKRCAADLKQPGTDGLELQRTVGVSPGSCSPCEKYHGKGGMLTKALHLTCVCISFFYPLEIRRSLLLVVWWIK